jgi:hypothetical protein
MGQPSPNNPGFPAILAPQGVRFGFLNQQGATWFVNTLTGKDTLGGFTRGTAFATVGKAVASALPGDVILVAPGTYPETVTIPYGAGPLTIMAMGPAGSVKIAPTTTNANALVNNADDVTLIGLSLVANGTGTGLVNSGARCHPQGCSFSSSASGGLGVNMIPGTTAQQAALTNSTALNCFLDSCEFTKLANGLALTGVDAGALTGLQVKGCRFHVITTDHIKEVVGSGGAAAATYADLSIDSCVFGRNAAGAEPTAYILLNGNNANNGIVTKCSFPTAHNGGKNLVSTLLIWASNFMSDGISAAQPS